MRKPGLFLLAGAGLAWVVAVGAGFALLSTYKSTPALAGEPPPASWPAASRIGRTPGRPALLMFVHPRCPCTRASVAELGRLLARLEGGLTAHVLVVRPRGAAPDWDHTSLWERSASLPGVRVERDEDGLEAQRFNALTSGQTIVYDARGRLLFSGGVTSARGHEGQSFGQRRIVSLLTTGQADRPDSPIFGCSLIGADRAETRAAHPTQEERHEHR